jgi:predicted MFS family arabinose efflux permease
MPDRTSQRWAHASVRLSIALAFADASVVVLALPQVVIRLHTSISHVTWVITAYNLSLIACTVAIVPFASRLASRAALVAGLAIFGLASLGSGAAGNLTVLIVFRCVQGAGAALLVCSSLPLFTGADGSEASSLHRWATTAAIGAALGPAAGGMLTQLFDWRAIFLAQAPVAGAAALLAIVADLRPGSASTGETTNVGEGAAHRPLSPALANVSLALLSAALIGALFLATVLLINVWQLSPLGAAAVLAVIPLMTAITGHLAKPRPERAMASLGAIVLALGLALLAQISHRELVPALVTLGLCGGGLGLAFPSLTTVALETHGPLVARAARTVAAREGGLVLGLVLLTPIFVNQLSGAEGRATPPIAKAVIGAPVSLGTKFELGAGLESASAKAPQSQLPDFGPPFARAAAGASASTRSTLSMLEAQVKEIVVRTVTRCFREPLLLCALLSLLSLVPLGIASRRASASAAYQT